VVKKITFPASKKLEHKNSDKYDELIAVWTDYFNKKFEANPPLDPDVVKALIASESGFREDPPENKIAFGIAQITPETFKAIQDPKGEVKDFIFNDIRKKDLKDPNINIPMAVRWLHRKKRLAEGKLGRPATAEEIILEYKGLLKSKSDEKRRALKNFRENYDKLKNK
jgi:soluble lytic murein transglycosylase-like protein